MGAPERTVLGMQGQAVRDWQAYLNRQFGESLKIDGDHGPKTEAATNRWERAQEVPTPRPSYQSIPGADSKWVTEVITDPSYTHVPRDPGSVLWLTLHTGETGLSDASARGMAYDLKRRNNASAHYVVGPSVVIQQVPERFPAGTQAPNNLWCISIEHTGRSLPYKDQPATIWESHQDLLLTSARLARDICDRNGIPWRKLDDDQILRREKGIVYHGDLTRVFKVIGGHCDPRNWPIELWLSMGAVVA